MRFNNCVSGHDGFIEWEILHIGERRSIPSTEIEIPLDAPQEETQSLSLPIGECEVCCSAFVARFADSMRWMRRHMPPPRGFPKRKKSKSFNGASGFFKARKAMESIAIASRLVTNPSRPSDLPSSKDQSDQIILMHLLPLRTSGDDDEK